MNAVDFSSDVCLRTRLKKRNNVVVGNYVMVFEKETTLLEFVRELYYMKKYSISF